MAGVSRLQYSTEIRLIRVMCTGRIDLAFILKAFSNGSDGVFIGGCHLGECNYVTAGNYSALSMVLLCRKLLEHIGVNPERLRLEWCSSGEGIRFAQVMNEFSKKMKELGPLGQGEGIDDHEVKAKLKQVAKLVPYIKIAKREKLGSRLENEEAYDGFFTSDEIDTLFREVPSYYIDPKNQIHVIDQDRCIKCGTCLEACPPKFGAVKKISGEPAPPPIPKEERTIVRKSKEK